ncbi:MAG: NYN domain-containing protein [Calditrichia bacterium]
MKKQIVIDGYNLLRSSAYPLAQKLDLEEQRNELIRQLQTYSAKRGEKIVLVFDNSSGSMHQKSHGSLLHIIYSAASQEADDVIQALIRKSSNARSMIIVSSDRAIRHTAKDHGAMSMRSESFCADLLSSDESTTTYSTETPQDEDLSADEVAYWKRLFEEGKDE